MSGPRESAPSPDVDDRGHDSSKKQYAALYQESIEHPDEFWGSQADKFYWNKKWSAPVCKYNFDVTKGPAYVKWFEEGETNICYNALDRHVEAGHGDRIAFYWEGNDLDQQATVSYRQLLAMVCQAANYLRSAGVRKGDDVTIYMPMIPELPAMMLACARIGAVHSVVFAGFSAEALAGRILDSSPRVVVTASATRRADKQACLKAEVDEALALCEAGGHVVDTCLVVRHAAGGGQRVAMQAGRDVWWHKVVAEQPKECPVEWVEAEHPLFKLYTSGSTGQPKGVLHTTGGYMVGAAATFLQVLGYRQEDVYWCTADCGWVTGHSYVTYGPLLNCASQVLFEGTPTWPDAGRCWAVVDKYAVSVYYTSPSALRALRAKGDEHVVQHSRASLRLLGTVGEPINPDVWRWYHTVVGNGRCPIIDTWWQTETGAHMIAPLEGVSPVKPGSAGLPFFGVEPCVLDEQGRELQGECEGYLCMKRPWPSCLRTLSGDHARFTGTYFSMFPGYYFSGDGCRRDADGYYWIIGRVDDVINVSGHRIGTAEVESALVEHAACAEAAVVPVEHPIKGQGIYAFVTLMEGHSYPPAGHLREELIATVRRVIGPLAAPDAIHWAPGLPKTRSGKIMRRILRKIASREEDQLGDVSTLADPGVVQQLIELRGQ